MIRRQHRSPIEDELQSGRRRLAIGYALGMALALCGVLLGGYFLHSAMVRNTLSTELAQLSQREAEVHKPDLQAWMDGATGPADVSIGYRPHRTAFYYIMSPEAELVHGNETQPELREAVLSHLMANDLPRDEVVFHDLAVDEAEDAVRLALLRHPVEGEDGTYLGSVFAATDVGGALAHLDQLLRIMFALALGVVVLAGAGGWWMADRSLLPLRRALIQQREFIANASHELRGPLTVMQTALSMVERDAGEKLGAFHRQSLQDASEETRRLGDLAARLLLLARADAGALELRRAPLDLAAVVARQVRLHQSRAEAKGQQLGADLPPEAPCSGDADLLAQAVTAGLDNAMHYTPKGGRIDLSLNDSGTGWRLVIADTGPGMDAQARANAFARFFRADSARSRHNGGAGLGLPILREIIELHGGRAEIDSQPGAGTKLVLTLPR